MLPDVTLLSIHSSLCTNLISLWLNRSLAFLLNNVLFVTGETLSGKRGTHFRIYFIVLLTVNHWNSISFNVWYVWWMTLLSASLRAVKAVTAVFWGELRQFPIRSHFVPQETHGRTLGARLVPDCVWRPHGVQQPCDQRKLVPPCRNSLNTQLCSALRVGGNVALWWQLIWVDHRGRP